MCTSADETLAKHQRNADEAPAISAPSSAAISPAKGVRVHPAKWPFTLPQLAGSHGRIRQACCDVTLPQKVTLLRPFSRDNLCVSSRASSRSTRMRLWRQLMRVRAIGGPIWPHFRESAHTFEMGFAQPFHTRLRRVARSGAPSLSSLSAPFRSRALAKSLLTAIFLSFASRPPSDSSPARSSRHSPPPSTRGRSLSALSCSPLRRGARDEGVRWRRSSRCCAPCSPLRGVPRDEGRLRFWSRQSCDLAVPSGGALGMKVLGLLSLACHVTTCSPLRRGAQDEGWKPKRHHTEKENLQSPQAGRSG